ncbi:MAG TPA: hypothetical protein VGX28_12985 [Frankiaceae bacterium]|nr:hypothetical protein [Frankiaceae bacterium]
MNDLQDLFATTAEGAPRPRALVERAHALAATRRRASARRRAGVAFAGVAVLAAAGAVTALRPTAKPTYVALGPGGTVRVGASEERCEGYSARVRGSEVPEAFRLVSNDPDLRQARPAFARHMTSECGTAAVPLALVRVAADGTTARGLTLSGPLPERLTAIRDEDGHEVRVRGVRGTLVAPGGRVSALTWKERGGRAWVLSSTGNTEAELIAYADALELGADGSARLPEPMTRGFRDLGTRAATDRYDAYVWYLTYVNAAGHEVEIEATPHEGPLGEWLTGGRPELSREVSVEGKRGIYLTNGDTFGQALQLLQWEVSPGVRGSVSGDGVTYDELMELATSVVPAPADHPAVATAE